MFSNPATAVEPSRKAGNSPTAPHHHQLIASPMQASKNKNIPSTTTVTAKACQQIGLPTATRNTRALRTCLARPLLVSSHQHPPPQRHGLGEICNSGQAVGVKGRQAKRGAPDMELEHHLREESVLSSGLSQAGAAGAYERHGKKKRYKAKDRTALRKLRPTFRGRQWRVGGHYGSHCYSFCSRFVDQQGEGANDTNTCNRAGLLGLGLRGGGRHSTALSGRGVICHIIVAD